jgi:ABC-type bacteriocin/lantibiotic exporter with double-glycine peptidase domain
MVRKYLFPFLVVGLLSSCNSKLPDTLFSLYTSVEAYHLDVPFVPQEEEGYCGPAALTSVLNYWKDEVDQRQIAEATYLPSIGGTLSFDLAHYAKAWGFHVELYSGSFQDLKDKILFGYPLMVAGGYQKDALGHYMVVTGYDDRKQQLIIHDGKSANVSIPYKKFFSLWNNTDRLTIFIIPQK